MRGTLTVPAQCRASASLSRMTCKACSGGSISAMPAAAKAALAAASGLSSASTVGITTSAESWRARSSSTWANPLAAPAGISVRSCAGTR